VLSTVPLVAVQGVEGAGQSEVAVHLPETQQVRPAGQSFSSMVSLAALQVYTEAAVHSDVEMVQRLSMQQSQPVGHDVEVVPVVDEHVGAGVFY
jgi:hypothetical protein